MALSYCGLASRVCTKTLTSSLFDLGKSARPPVSLVTFVRNLVAFARGFPVMIRASFSSSWTRPIAYTFICCCSNSARNCFSFILLFRVCLRCCFSKEAKQQERQSRNAAEFCCHQFTWTFGMSSQRAPTTTTAALCL